MQHGSCRWPDTYFEPGHLQQSCRSAPISSIYCGCFAYVKQYSPKIVKWEQGICTNNTGLSIKIVSQHNPVNSGLGGGWALSLFWLWIYLPLRGLVIYASDNSVIIGSGNGLAPNRCQAITWTNDDLASIGPFRTNFNKTFIQIHFSFKEMHLKMSAAKYHLKYSDLNALQHDPLFLSILHT